MFVYKTLGIKITIKIPYETVNLIPQNQFLQTSGRVSNFGIVWYADVVVEQFLLPAAFIQSIIEITPLHLFPCYAPYSNEVSAKQ